MLEEKNLSTTTETQSKPKKKSDPVQVFRLGILERQLHVDKPSVGNYLLDAAYCGFYHSNKRRDAYVRDYRWRHMVRGITCGLVQSGYMPPVPTISGKGPENEEIRCGIKLSLEKMTESRFRFSAQSIEEICEHYYTSIDELRERAGAEAIRQFCREREELLELARNPMKAANDAASKDNVTVNGTADRGALATNGTFEGSAGRNTDFVMGGGETPQEKTTVMLEVPRLCVVQA